MKPVEPNRGRRVGSDLCNSKDVEEGIQQGVLFVEDQMSLPRKDKEMRTLITCEGVLREFTRETKACLPFKHRYINPKV